MPKSQTQGTTKHMIDSYPLLSNMQFFSGSKTDSEIPKSQTQRTTEYDQFLPSPVQCAVLFRLKNWQWNSQVSDTENNRIWSIPTLSCPMCSSFQANMTVITPKTQRVKTHDWFQPSPVQCSLGSTDGEIPKTQTLGTTKHMINSYPLPSNVQFF